MSFLSFLFLFSFFFSFTYDRDNDLNAKHGYFEAKAKGALLYMLATTMSQITTHLVGTFFFLFFFFSLCRLSFSYIFLLFGSEIQMSLEIQKIKKNKKIDVLIQNYSSVDIVFKMQQSTGVRWFHHVCSCVLGGHIHLPHPYLQYTSSNKFTTEQNPKLPIHEL